MKLIAVNNPGRRGGRPKTRPSLGELVGRVSGIGVGPAERREKDIRRGRVDKYFLGRLAPGESKGGDFSALRSVVKLLVKLMEPLAGRLYDGCYGSDNTFV